MKEQSGIQVNGTRTQLLVDNIKCGGCGKTITKELNELGFSNVEVNPEASMVEFDNPIDQSNLNLALSKLKELGYPLVETEEGLKALALKAKSYLSCAIGKMS